MIAVAFIVVLVVIGGILALRGGGSPLMTQQLLLVGGLFVVFFVAGFYVASVLGWLSLATDFAYAKGKINEFFGQIAWNASANFAFTAIPMFLVMGEILNRSGLATRMYRALGIWLGGLPGGLLHINIAAAAAFSTVSGSTAATAATVGSVALPNFTDPRPKVQRRVLGSVVAGGALGQLIPPSIAFIVYSLFTNTSVAQLYNGGMIAGIIVALACMGWIALRYRSVDGVSMTADRPKYTWADRRGSLKDLLPVAILMVIVLASIYAGFATATEAAAIGVTGAIVVAAGYRRCSWRMLNEAVIAGARTTSMIGLITIFAYCLNYVLGFIGLPKAIAKSISDLPLPAWGIMLIIIFFYLALGTFMEGISMMITTVSVMFPVVMGLGYDPIWFGVVMVLLIEISLICPPDGVVLYIIQGLRKPPGPIMDVFRGATPFVLIYLAVVVLLTVFPGIITWIT